MLHVFHIQFLKHELQNSIVCVDIQDYRGIDSFTAGYVMKFLVSEGALNAKNNQRLSAVFNDNAPSRSSTCAFYNAVTTVNVHRIGSNSDRIEICYETNYEN
jgi:hypothetical protein